MGTHVGGVSRVVLGKMMLWLTLALLSQPEAFPGSGHGFLSRVKRDDCAAIQTAHGECTSKAYADYQAEWAAGDDGRPDRSVLKILVRLHGCLEQLLIEQLAECQCCKEDLSCL